VIHVVRSPAPPALVDPAGKAAEERRHNDAMAAAGQFDKMTFKAYKHPSVMPALTEMFHGKCAYCESRYVAQQPGDVEHFRPKALVAVRGADGKVEQRRGYHWLAADWSNLLPSCADCNRPRQHQVRRGRGKRVLGKANWFPVEPEAARATLPGAEDVEPRLLLDPCRDDPAAHLFFDHDGTVAPRVVAGVPSAIGAASIEYCALERLELAQERHKRGVEVLYVIDNLLDAMNRGDSAALLRHEARLRTMTDAQAEYSACANALLARHLPDPGAVPGL
jgi:uncharacterized protein (TIGR02646 family)